MVYSAGEVSGLWSVWDPRKANWTKTDGWECQEEEISVCKSPGSTVGRLTVYHTVPGGAWTGAEHADCRLCPWADSSVTGRLPWTASWLLFSLNFLCSKYVSESSWLSSNACEWKQPVSHRKTKYLQFPSCRSKPCPSFYNLKGSWRIWKNRNIYLRSREIMV